MNKSLVFTHHYASPLGGITLASDGEALIGSWFDGQKYFMDALERENEEKVLPVFEEAVQKLKAAGITVIVHQILGLPGETEDMMSETARYIGSCGADGIKFHLLHVLRGTDLATDWEAGTFNTMTPEQYISVLETCLRQIPRSMVVHRLTGDGAKRDLLSPLWSGDKKRVLNAIRTAFLRNDLEQGSNLR